MASTPDVLEGREIEMLHLSGRGFWGVVFVCCGLCLLLGVAPTWGQTSSQGTVNLSVEDQSGAVIQAAKLVLVDLSTNEVRTAETMELGTYSFVALPLGQYKLTVSKEGFKSRVYDLVAVQGGRNTDIKVTLMVGAAIDEIVVSASEVPLLETSSSAVATTIDLKQIEGLPLQGRNISALAQLSPGYSGTGGNGTWNGLPLNAQANTIDGVVSSTSRMKFGGNVSPGLEARLESLEEMTIQTGQTDLSQGMGMAAMQVNFITRRGSNDYHGRVFEDFRNTVLNANSWLNNAVGQRKTPIILNEFGGSVGGHIIKDKLFFFGSFSMAKRPGGYQTSNSVLTAAAQQGILTRVNGTQVNLFTQVAPIGSPTSVGAPFAAQQALINAAVSSGGATLSDSGDPNFQTLNWLVGSPTTTYYPAFRVDYNVSKKVHVDFSYQETKINNPNAAAPFFPGSGFANTAGSNKSSNYTASIGVSWTITPTLTNQFRGGYYYNWYVYSAGATPTWLTVPQVSWAIASSGQTFNLPVSTYYPVVNASDSATWAHGRHGVTFGFDFYREQDHYWNPPDGMQNIALGLVNGDPAFQAFETFFPGDTQDTTDAEALYSTLIGRISGVGPTGSGFPYSQKSQQYATKAGSAYNLDELSKAWGLYAQDAYRITPHLTLNYGLRWDFTGDNHDLTSAYHGAKAADMYGPSGLGNVFKPGTLTGDANPAYIASSHQYNGWNVTPQPTIGIAWNPNYSEGILGKVFKGGNTVIRAGFDLKRFTEPYQYFWNNASNHGMAFFQSFALTPGSGGVGTFAPGSLTYDGNQLNSDLFSKSPQAYAASLPQSDFTFQNYFSGAGFDPHVKQPYVQEWNLGIQRQFGSSSVLEVRYLGHRSLHQWIGVDTNEVNVFENGFLSEFKNAQANLGLCMANPACAAHPSFANTGLTGQVNLPIMSTAFGGAAASDFTNGSFITDLNRGAVGALADVLANPFGTVPYICNLVGSSLTPCATSYGFDTPGTYPLNFFQANPYANGVGHVLYGDTAALASFMSARGYGTYHALQIDFRQKQWHGMQFDVNYTWSHTLGIQPDNQWTGNVNIFTIRNLRASYAPTAFDLRHVVHASGTYDLPFGKGKPLFNSNKIVDKVAGGWSLGTIIGFETGFPFQLTGAFNTFNDYGAGGFAITGDALSKLQASVGKYAPPCPSGSCGYVNAFASNLLAAPPSSVCNSRAIGICQNIDPGTFGAHAWLYGPRLWNADISVTKVVPIGERLRFSLQGEFLNAFNHPNFANPNGNVASSSFGHSGPSNFNGPRAIELRANFSF
jgi:Carboxypeptidase regulatory-like domain